MIKIGEYQDLEIARIKEQGAYLKEREAGDAFPSDQHEDKRKPGKDSAKKLSENAVFPAEVLLPKKQIPEGAAAGTVVRVFIYRDSSDRLIATTASPAITLGQVRRLKVVQKTKIGAFLGWGLEKDLLLPFHEMTGEIREGDEILAALYVDKSGRLAATMKLYPYLKRSSPYQTGDSVQGTVYQNADNFGTFVAVDDQYSGMVPKKDAQRGFRVGETLTFRVTGVKEDGKLDLSTRDKAYLEISEDAEKLLEKIREEYGGELPFDDKADPEVIREVFGLSKAAFKRAVGHLYRERRVALSGGKILCRSDA